MYALFPDTVEQPADHLYLPTPFRNRHQVRDEHYFDRYFTFGFPAEDVRDAPLVDELTKLLSGGELPDGSQIRLFYKSNSSDRVKRVVFGVKIGDILQRILKEQDIDGAHYGDAACVLTSFTTRHERDHPDTGSWWAAISHRLWKALAYEDQSAAREAVVNYTRQYGPMMLPQQPLHRSFH
ncbi:hypothetical protein NJ76_27760 [Rhodococcus sp. IITR03]|nr:hypothetical protein NJ76_27760 [Rhodococcus sp. IITR03]